MYRRLNGAALAVAGMLSVATASASEPIRIGVTLPITGPASMLGDPQAKAIKHFAEKINNSGGWLGRKIELFVYDDTGAAEKAVGFAKRLINQDNVHVVIGSALTGSSMAMVPLMAENKVPQIAVAGGTVLCEPVKPWTFKTPPSDKLGTLSVFADFKKHGITKIALIYGTDGFGQSGAAVTKQLAPEHGITIVADETYDPRDIDMTAQLTKIRAAADVQVVYNIGFGASGAILVKNARQIGISGLFYESHGVNHRSFIDLSGPAANDVRMPVSPLLIAEQLPDDHPLKAVTTSFKTEWLTTFKEMSSPYAGYGYDALMMALEAVKMAGEPDRIKIRDQLEKLSHFPGVSGVYNMSPTDHCGLDIDSLQMAEIKKGNWVLLK